MKIKCQKIPDSIWAKLEEISELKEGSWNMMTIVNECLNTGANWWLKKIKIDLGMIKREEKKDDKKEAGNQPASHERIDNNISQAEKEAIEIARTPWVGCDM